MLMFSVIFDMDGVIFDSETLSLTAWKIVAEHYGLENIEEVFIKCIGASRSIAERIMEEHYGKKASYQTLKRMKSDVFKQLYSEGALELKRGARELLDYLSHNGVPIGLATSTNRNVVERELNDYDLYKYFNAVVCGDEVINGKPEPDIYLNICKELGVSPETAYAVEDSKNGIISANRAGLKPIFVIDLIQPEKIPDINKNAIMILQDLFELKQWFETEM